MVFATNKKSDDSDYQSYRPAEDSSKSYLGKSLKIKGEIESDEVLTIEGQVEGKIKVNNTLTIGKTGNVNGEITATILKIDGIAEGTVTATEKLEISSMGKCTGDITAEKLVIAEGALFKGTINMDAGKEKKSDKK